MNYKNKGIFFINLPFQQICVSSKTVWRVAINSSSYQKDIEEMCLKL